MDGFHTLLSIRNDRILDTARDLCMPTTDNETYIDISDSDSAYADIACIINFIYIYLQSILRNKQDCLTIEGRPQAIVCI